MRPCEVCYTPYVPRARTHIYCSRKCCVYSYSSKRYKILPQWLIKLRAEAVKAQRLAEMRESIRREEERLQRQTDKQVRRQRLERMARHRRNGQ